MIHFLSLTLAFYLVAFSTDLWAHSSVVVQECHIVVKKDTTIKKQEMVPNSGSGNRGRSERVVYNLQKVNRRGDCDFLKSRYPSHWKYFNTYGPVPKMGIKGQTTVSITKQHLHVPTWDHLESALAANHKQAQELRTAQIQALESKLVDTLSHAYADTAGVLLEEMRVQIRQIVAEEVQNALSENPKP